MSSEINERAASDNVKCTAMQMRETELNRQLQEHKDHIVLLQEKLKARGADKADVNRQPERLQPSFKPARGYVVVRGETAGAGNGAVGTVGSVDSSLSSLSAWSPGGSPLQSVARVAGGLCRKCMSQLTAVDVESALDMAIALGKLPQLDLVLNLPWQSPSAKRVPVGAGSVSAKLM